MKQISTVWRLEKNVKSVTSKSVLDIKLFIRALVILVDHLFAKHQLIPNMTFTLQVTGLIQILLTSLAPSSHREFSMGIPYTQTQSEEGVRDVNNIWVAVLIWPSIDLFWSLNSLGIVSYGINSVRKVRQPDGRIEEIPMKCGKKDVPGIYTKVSEYLPWIYSNMVTNN